MISHIDILNSLKRETQEDIEKGLDLFFDIVNECSDKSSLREWLMGALNSDFMQTLISLWQNAQFSSDKLMNKKIIKSITLLMNASVDASVEYRILAPHCKSILDDHMKQITREVSQISDKVSLNLNLLAAIVTVGPTMADLVYQKFSWQIKTLYKFPVTRSFGIRKAYMKFILSFIKCNEAKIKREIIFMKNFGLSSLFKGLKSDDSESIQQILIILEKFIIYDKSLPDSTFCFLFNRMTVGELLELYSSSDETLVKSVNHLVSQLTCQDKVALNTGCNIQDPNIISGKKDLGQEKRINSLLNLLEILDIESLHQRNALLMILEKNPKVVPFYLSKLKDGFEPRESSQWLQKMNLISKVAQIPIQLQDKSHQSFKFLVDSTFPSGLSRQVLSKQIQHQNLFVKYVSCVQLTSMLSRINQFLMDNRQSNTEDYNRLLLTKIPDFQVVISLYQSIQKYQEHDNIRQESFIVNDLSDTISEFQSFNDKSALKITAVKLIAVYASLFRSQDFIKHFDFGKLFTSIYPLIDKMNSEIQLGEQEFLMCSIFIELVQSTYGLIKWDQIDQGRKQSRLMELIYLIKNMQNLFGTSQQYFTLINNAFKEFIFFQFHHHEIIILTECLLEISDIEVAQSVMNLLDESMVSTQKKYIDLVVRYDQLMKFQDVSKFTQDNFEERFHYESDVQILNFLLPISQDQTSPRKCLFSVFWLQIIDDIVSSVYWNKLDSLSKGVLKWLSKVITRVLFLTQIEPIVLLNSLMLQCFGLPEKHVVLVDKIQKQIQQGMPIQNSSHYLLIPAIMHEKLKNCELKIQDQQIQITNFESFVVQCLKSPIIQIGSIIFMLQVLTTEDLSRGTLFVLTMFRILNQECFTSVLKAFMEIISDHENKEKVSEAIIVILLSPLCDFVLGNLVLRDLFLVVISQISFQTSYVPLLQFGLDKLILNLTQNVEILYQLQTYLSERQKLQIINFVHLATFGEDLFIEQKNILSLFGQIMSDSDFDRMIRKVFQSTFSDQSKYQVLDFILLKTDFKFTHLNVILRQCTIDNVLLYASQQLLQKIVKLMSDEQFDYFIGQLSQDNKCKIAELKQNCAKQKRYVDVIKQKTIATDLNARLPILTLSRLDEITSKQATSIALTFNSHSTQYLELLQFGFNYLKRILIEENDILDLYPLFSKNMIAIPISALSSDSISIRKLGLTQIMMILQIFEKADTLDYYTQQHKKKNDPDPSLEIENPQKKFRKNYQLERTKNNYQKFVSFQGSLENYLLLNLLINSASYHSQKPLDQLFDYRVPTLITTFAIKSIQVLLHPHSELYSEINQFLLSRPIMDFEDIPMFLKLFHSTNIDHGRAERLWILDLIAHGLETEQDYQIAEKRHLKELLVTASAYETDSKIKDLMNNILNKFESFDEI